jgi:hypothetical protein
MVAYAASMAWQQALLPTRIGIPAADTLLKAMYNVLCLSAHQGCLVYAFKAAAVAGDPGGGDAQRVLLLANCCQLDTSCRHGAVCFCYNIYLLSKHTLR